MEPGFALTNSLKIKQRQNTHSPAAYQSLLFLQKMGKKRLIACYITRGLYIHVH